MHRPFQQKRLDGRDEKGHDTRYYIFKELYQCSIPVMQMRTLEDIQMFGTPVSGLPEWDKWMQNERREIMIPISKMVEYWDKGCHISVVKRSDTKRIYDRISAHLEAWADHLKYSLNVAEAPLEDLRKLDQFANVIYEYAKWHFDRGVLEGILSKMKGDHQRKLASFIQSMSNVDLTNNAIQNSSHESKAKNFESELPRRRSLADAFLPRSGTAARHQHVKETDPNSLNSEENLNARPKSLSELMMRRRS